MTKTKEALSERAQVILDLVTSKDNATPGRLPVPSSKDAHASQRLAMMEDMEHHLQVMDSMRQPTQRAVAVDISLAEYMRDTHGFAVSDNGAPDAFLEALGIDPGVATIESLTTTGDRPEGFRWLIPELIREAVRLGLDRPAHYRSWIHSEITIGQPSVTMPSINESDAMPTKIGEAATIPVGNVSFGQRSVKTHKVGVGLQLTDEVVRFTPLNLLSVFLGDFGRKLNLGLDNLGMDVLLNGDQADGSMSAPVVGTESGTSFAYLDMLRVWLRMGRLGRLPQGMLMNEAPALSILQMAEFKGFSGGSTTQKLNVKTPLPQTQDLYVTGYMPDSDHIMFLDATSALVKLNSMPLRVESERYVRTQQEGVFLSVMTGFANLFRDSRVLLERDATFASKGWPAYMDIDAYERRNKFK